MRIALLTLPEETAPDVRVLGRPLAEWQCEMALSLGCERILLVAPALTEPALDIQHLAEAGGAKFQIVPHAHRLLGQLRTDDELLVLDPALLVRGGKAKELLETPRRIFVLPDTAADDGFERLDRETLWAGALWLPGAMVEQLADLDSDAEPGRALLRIAASRGVRRHTLREDSVGKADWIAIGTVNEGLEIGRVITTDKLGRSPDSPGDWLAHRLVRGALVGGRKAAQVGQLGLALGSLSVLSAAGLLASGFPLWSIGVAGAGYLAGRIGLHAGRVEGWKPRLAALPPAAALVIIAAALAVVIAAGWTWSVAGFVTAMVCAWSVEAVRDGGSSGAWFADGVFLALVFGISGAFGFAFGGAVLVCTLAIAAIWAARWQSRS